MKLKSLRISNVISFKYREDINDVQVVSYNEKLNIILGQNGSGKSTALEVINFIFRRVLFIPYNRNQDLYTQRDTINHDQRKNILTKINDVQYYKDFSLDKNYDFEDKPQTIQVVVRLDDIDRANIQHIKDNGEKLSPVVGLYTAEQMFGDGDVRDEYQIDIHLDSVNKTFRVETTQDLGYTYLTAYNLYKEIIEMYNEENPESQINNLTESFALIGGYRNYNSYSPHVSIGGNNTAPKQIQQHKLNEYSRSTNSTENNEPTIFSLVRLKMAERCYNLIETNLNRDECEQAANDLQFIRDINDKLGLINLKIEIKLIDRASWNFAFSFKDTKRNRVISKMNSLSAGQKAITHLVLEAFGRGELKGGLVIIDEPEIHLHYQFQNEYLRVIDKLNAEQKCQYILVTHSESLINSETIHSVIRFSLDENGYTKINQPTINTDQKWLVKILDIKRSTHAFFGSKVLLVEGEDDRYFFRAVLGEIEEKHKRGYVQDISILDINGKDKVEEWRELFTAFGLKTYFIGDLDYSWRLYGVPSPPKINTREKADVFLREHPDAIQKIEGEYSNGIFILKQGDLEIYLDIQKDLLNVIQFCNNDLKTYLVNSSDSRVQELKGIMAKITEQNEADLW